ncbi:MAG: serine/threonine-protein kinase [Planctomycetota bacterium]
MSWSPGQEVGPYRVERRLGQGGMGEVYLAYERTLDRWVALKVVSAGNLDPELELRLRREALALAKLQHPHVLRVLRTFEHAGRTVLVTEFVEGETLAQRVARGGPLPVAQALEVTRQCAEAIAAAHAEGVLHRDLKPENVMLGPTGVKVMDFGIARDLGLERLTRTGDVLGTPGYMPPEALRGDSPGPWNDVFGVGALLFFLLSGEPPFSGRTRLERLAATAAGTVRSLRELRADVPRWVAEVCARALETAPADRGGAAELAVALSEGRAPRRRVSPGVLAAALCLALLGPLGVFVALQSRRGPSQPGPRLAESPERPAPARSRWAQELGFSGWPDEELASELHLFEPWLFSRSPAGRLELRAQGPTAPELALPLLLGKGGWEVEVGFSWLNLEPQARLCLALVESAPLDDRRRRGDDRSSEPRRFVCVDLQPSTSRGLWAHPRWGGELGEHDGLELRTDPRGPLTLSLGWSDGALTLAVKDDEGVVASGSYPLGSELLPRSPLTLRLGQLNSATQLPSLGDLRTAWHQDRCEFELERLVVRASSVLSDHRSGTNPSLGRGGWESLTAVDDEALRARAAEVGTQDFVIAERWGQYCRALLAARRGDEALAARLLVALQTMTETANEGLEFRDWRDSSFWLRNRLSADLFHFSPSLRGRLGAGLADLLDAREALAQAKDEALEPQPAAAFWGDTPQQRRVHARAWAWVQYALRRGAELDDELPLAQAGLLEEAWAHVLAHPVGDKTHDLRRGQQRGRIAFRLGAFDAAAELWRYAQPPRELLTPAALELCRRYAARPTPRELQPPWARK